MEKSEEYKISKVYTPTVMIPRENDFYNIKQILGEGAPKRLKSTILKHSAVLILLYNHSNSYTLILTERTRNMKHHSGEISFPGGRYDPTTDFNIIETALRECEEEIGINKESIEILGQLDDVPTMTGYIITPVVGKLDIPNPKFTRNEVEVEQIFPIPIDFFLNPTSFREQCMIIEGKRFPIFMFDYTVHSKRYTIWGATAHILVDYLKKIHHYNPSHLPHSRYSMEEIEEILKHRQIKAFNKEKKNHIKNILEKGGSKNGQRKTGN
ncbi:MAG: CoA pyrophosphatase [Candidatus Lokiarchaeota archaeon]|nr:CoA pyrophosphatase [Candidatus Lokiarchaeota archaeon]